VVTRMQATCRKNSYILQKGTDAVYNSADGAARMSGGGAARSAVFSAANSLTAQRAGQPHRHGC
jgi:hypothetical protein